MKEAKLDKKIRGQSRCKKTNVIAVAHGKILALHI